MVADEQRTVPVEALAGPAQLIQWYLQRWQIETFFRILKSGCQVEGLQLETPERTRNCLALYLIIAWRIYFLTSQNKAMPEASCETVLEKAEWEILWMLDKRTPPPEKAPDIKTAMSMLAKLGGYLARRHDSPPGPKAIWLGLTQLYHAINAIEIARNSYG